MGLKTATEHQAAQDGSRFPSLIGVSGTAGTSDTTGTAEIVRIGANPTTGALYTQEVNSAVGLLHGTLGTAGGSFFATISAASGAGTRHFVSHVDVVMQSGTADVRVLAGTVIQGTGVLAAGFFSPSGGIHADFNPAFATGTNSELTYHFVGAGTAFIKTYYWKGI